MRLRRQTPKRIAEREEARRVERLDAVNAAATQSFEDLSAAAIAGTLSDELNPAFLFSVTDSALLSAIVAGRIDVRAVALRELQNRGRDFAGRFVGFQGKAARS